MSSKIPEIGEGGLVYADLLETHPELRAIVVMAGDYLDASFAGERSQEAFDELFAEGKKICDIHYPEENHCSLTQQAMFLAAEILDTARELKPADITQWEAI
jgi:hypothetical protein